MAHKNFKKYLQVFLQIQKINIMKRMAYPASFFFSVAITVVLMAISILFINVNFSYINNLAGWSYYQMLAVVGSYMIVEGIMWVFMGQLNAINRHIIDGTLDGILLKPIDDQYFASIWRGEQEDYVRIITGLFLILVAMKNTIGFNFLHSLLFLPLLFDGFLLLYSFNLAIRSASFWFTDASGLWLLMERITNNSQFPVDIYYHKAVKNFLTFIIPLAFISTVPAKMITSIDVDWKFFFLSLSMTIFCFLLSRKFWKFSLKHYSSASS